MNILEYCIDVDKTKEEIFKLCDNLGISYEDENTILSDDDITLLDNEIQQMDNNEEQEDNEDLYDDELEEKIEKILIDEKIDIDNHRNKEKLKSKAERVESGKNNFKSMRKEMYKHREKLKSNETKDDNIVVYKVNMTVTELSNAMGINPLDIINDMTTGLQNNNYEIEINREKAIIKGIQKLTKNDILLVLGKGHETYQIINGKKIYFSDKEKVIDFIRR